MPADDSEVHDEARQVAMTAAAAAARIAETVAREVRERVDRDRAKTERQDEQRQAEAALRGWDGQRPNREVARQNLPPEVRAAFRLGDVSTGIDPAQAAAAGRKPAASGKLQAPSPVLVPVADVAPSR